jgi:hypothetical protein
MCHSEVPVFYWRRKCRRDEPALADHFVKNCHDLARRRRGWHRFLKGVMAFLLGSLSRILIREVHRQSLEEKKF